MRYIKPPKQLSQIWWLVGKGFPSLQHGKAYNGYGEKNPKYIAEYIAENPNEYHIDVEVFRSALITELLNLKEG